MYKKKIVEPLLLKIIRIITALTFIFSSIVKAIDPLGTNYRVIDYLDVYGWYFLTNLSLVITVVLISVEFVLGVALLFKLRTKIAAAGILLIMIFFTVVTYFDATYNLVPDCGCFGDAVKLTNWQTFYKNIVLVIFALVIFIWQKKISQNIRPWLQSVIILLFLIGIDMFMYHNYTHLPVIDFRDWKEGNNMKSTGQETVVNYLVYKNKSTEEIKEYVSPNYPWNDSTWLANWEFVKQRIDDSHLVLKHGLIIEDLDGNDITADIIENPRYQLLLISNDLDMAVGDGMIKASELYNSLEDIDFVMLTSSPIEVIDSYRSLYAIDYDVYFADDIELKAMIRSNPGMLLLKDGLVIKKWSYKDFPSSKQIDELTK